MPNALITGASRGLGRALALELAGRGWDVIITARTAADLDEVVEAGTPRVRAIAGTVRDAEHRARLAALAGSSLDLLVNNASHLGPSPLAQVTAFTPDELHAVYDTNVVAPLALVALVAPALHKAGGTVVNVSSDAAAEVYERWGPYGSSKAALDHASAVLAKERPDIAVYAFDPGDMRTAMHQAAFPGEDISDRQTPESVVPALMRLVEEDVVSGRYSVADFASAPAR